MPTETTIAILQRDLEELKNDHHQVVELIKNENIKLMEAMAVNQSVTQSGLDKISNILDEHDTRIKYLEIESAKMEGASRISGKLNWIVVTVVIGIVSSVIVPLLGLGKNSTWISLISAKPEGRMVTV